jgi:hypothetical protein
LLPTAGAIRSALRANDQRSRAECSAQSSGGYGLSPLGGVQNAIHGVEAVHHALEADKVRPNARRGKPSRVQLALVA